MSPGATGFAGHARGARQEDAVTLEEIVIGLIRIAGSLPVLRWALAGALIAIVVDFSDLFWWNLIDLGGLRNYQAFDKWIDLVYMGTFLLASLRWRGTARNVAIALFGYRMIGFAVFELTQTRQVLMAFPNVFEFWFVFVAARNQFAPRYALTVRRAALWLLVLLALKEGQEYFLHGWQYLDRFNAIDVVVDWWNWLTGWF